MLRTTMAAGVVAALLAAAGASPARADGDGPESADARIQRLEEALRAQAAETARLRQDFDAYRQSNPPATAPSQSEIAAAVSRYLATSGPSSVEVAPSVASSGGVR